MKILIVAKTRQGGGACIGGISADGRSVRLIALDHDDERWGLKFEVGDVWEIEGSSPAQILPPHTENLVVRSRKFIRHISDPVPTILRFMPAAEGSPSVLFNGLAQTRPSSALFIAEASGVPDFSTMFWTPDKPLKRDGEGKRIRYHYPTSDGSQSLVFVGFQEPPTEIPAGALLRVSLAHWWRPRERPDEELRCFVQLSGWFSLDGRHGTYRTDRTYSVRPSIQVAQTPEAKLDDARSAMARVFGFHEFRTLQEEIITNVLNERPTFGVMPTGSGKSLCYQLPAIVNAGLTVVVSPLIALMQDQINHLRQAGVPAVTLNSSLAFDDYRDNARRVRAGESKLLYVAPETLLRPETLVLLEESNVSLLTIDEAHCISEWGHDFRPEYRQIAKVIARFPHVSRLALTATATERVREDIRNILGIPAQDTFVAGFDRPNLYLGVQHRNGDGLEQVFEFLASRLDQPGIIYCSTRKQVDLLAADLAREGIQALPYHAGMDDESRRQNQRRFQRDEAQVMVATIAFGMGIDKPNIRFVIHATLPDCLETYYQQVGRAGRDGLRADCLMLHGRKDILTYNRFIDEGSEAQRPGRVARLQQMVRFAESQLCRRQTLLAYFGDDPPQSSCEMCDRCLAPLSGIEKVDVSSDARLFLSCTEQCKQKFGRGHIVDVLRGSKSQKVLDWRHDRVPAYGTGLHLKADRWKQLADRFIDAGLIHAELEHGTLQITDAGRRVLAGEPVFIAIEPAQISRREDEPAGYDAVLFEALRKLRKDISTEIGMPPFVVFHDSTLVQMASTYPTTMAALLQVNGVGEKKAASYGERFLDVVREHVEAYSIDPRLPDSSRLAPVPRPSRRRREIGEAYSEGSGIEAICEMWGIKRSTVIQHLSDYARSGHALDAGRILAECKLDTKERDRALAAFAQLGHERLGPVFEALNGEVPYEELHLLRLYRMASRS